MGMRAYVQETGTNETFSKLPLRDRIKLWARRL